jgi:predicted nucleic acid-binding protein
MYLIDSSVWVALFLDFDTQHEKAAEFFANLETEKKIYLPYGVISEVSTVLVYKHSKEQADKFLEYVRGNSDIVIFENQTVAEMEFFQKTREKVSFTDTTLIYLAKAFALTLITFDDQMVKLFKKD